MAANIQTIMKTFSKPTRNITFYIEVLQESDILMCLNAHKSPPANKYARIPSTGKSTYIY